MSDINAELAKAIDKVKKLRALATNNQNENEIKAATAAADRIMQEFRISNAMLEAQGERVAEPMVRKDVHKGGKRSSWVERILYGLCLQYGCAWYFQHGNTPNWDGTVKRFNTYIVVGRTSDTEIIAYMMEYLVGEGRRLARWKNEGFGVGWSKSYLEGFGIGVQSQFTAIKEKAKEEAKVANALLAAVGSAPTTTSAALVLLDKRKDEATAHMNSTCGFATYKRGPNKGEVKGSSCGGAYSNYGAMSDGIQDGKKARINPALKEG